MDMFEVSQPMTAVQPDALEANRAGRLTEMQRKNLRSESRGTRKLELQLAGGCIVIGLLVWFAAGPAKYASVKPLVGIAFFVIAGALVVRALLGSDAVTQDLRAGRVESVEGAVARWTNTVHSDGREGSRSTTYYYVQVGKVRAETGRGFYNLVPEAGIVRMFYLPHSHQLVNLEQLADRPLPDGSLTDPHVALSDAKDALLGGLLGDMTKQAEARAELAAIGHAMTGGAPTPGAERDPRPLSQTIVGTWRNPMMTLVFASDGAASMTSTLGGMHQEGRWSVDASGRLIADVAGSTQPADAWVAGGRLTVTLGRQSLSFERVSG